MIGWANFQEKNVQWPQTEAVELYNELVCGHTPLQTRATLGTILIWVLVLTEN